MIYSVDVRIEAPVRDTEVIEILKNGAGISKPESRTKLQPVRADWTTTRRCHVRHAARRLLPDVGMSRDRRGRSTRQWVRSDRVRFLQRRHRPQS